MRSAQPAVPAFAACPSPAPLPGRPIQLLQDDREHVARRILADEYVQMPVAGQHLQRVIVAALPLEKIVRTLLALGQETYVAVSCQEREARVRARRLRH